MLKEPVSMLQSQSIGWSRCDSSSCLIDDYFPSEKLPHLVLSSICTIPPLPRQLPSLKSVSETTVLLIVSVILSRLWTSVLTVNQLQLALWNSSLGGVSIPLAEKQFWGQPCTVL